MDTKSLKDVLQKDLDQLATLRDELRVQAKLARADFVDELDLLETRWLHLKDEIKKLADDSKLRSEIETRTRGVLDELKTSYERLKQELKM